MVKKKAARSNSSVNESQAPPILHVTYTDPLFSLAAHPTRPIIVTGLATGHVYCHTYDADNLEDCMEREREIFMKLKEEFGSISNLKTKWWSEFDCNASTENLNVAWKTKRHSGSCRSVIFDVQDNFVGEFVYSVGLDNIVKKANSETGKVIAKTNIASFYEDPKDAITTLVKSTTHPFLLAGTDDGHALVFDSTNLKSEKLKFKVTSLHEDTINKILPMPALSPYHYLSLGSTTLAHFDIRKGVITNSDNQDDELLAMCYPNDYVDRNKNDTVIVAHGEGILTLWKNSYNGLADQILRIKVNKNASIDAIVPTMNGCKEDMNDSVWCGDSDGLVHRVNYKTAKVVETRVHSKEMSKHGGADEVGGLEIDNNYRLVSLGMEGFKIWSDRDHGLVNEDVDHTDSSDDDTDLSSSLFSHSDSDTEDGPQLNWTPSYELLARSSKRNVPGSSDPQGPQKRSKKKLTSTVDADEVAKLRTSNGIMRFDGI